MKPYHSGVLFVHGIGLHKRGETLRSFGEPFIEWLSGWVSGAGAGKAAITDADLDPGQGAPAFAEVALEMSGAGQRWLLAESWWAEKFSPPRYRELLVWAAGIVPWTVLAHFAKRAWLQAARAGEVAPPVLFAALIREFLYFLAGVLLSPALVAVLLLILLLGLVPIGWVRKAAQSLQRLLAATLGDSYVLLASPIQRAAVEGQVRRDLAWLAERCETVSVVAHSQGAAIAHRVLQSRPPCNCKALVTAGSGLDKLLGIEAVERSADRWRVWLSPLALVYLAWVAQVTYLNLRLLGAGTSAAVLGFYVLLAVWLGLTQAGARWVRLIGWAGGIAGLAGAWYWAAEAMLRTGMLGVFALPGVALLGYGAAPVWNRMIDVERLRLASHIRWTDLYASADPVPNGRLLASTAEPGHKSAQVSNLRSILTDHNSYWENREQFVYACVCEAGVAAGLRLDALTPRDSMATPARRRLWRTAWLAAARWLTLILSLLLPARLWDRLPMDAGPMRDVLAPVAQLTGGMNARAAWAALVFAAAWLAYFVLAAIWRWWDRSEAERLFARRDFDLLSAPLCAFVFALGAGFEWGMLLALRPEGGLGVAALAACAGAYAVAGPVALQECSGRVFTAHFAKRLAAWSLFFWLALFPLAPWILSLPPTAITFRWGFGIYLAVVVIAGQLLSWTRLRNSLRDSFARWSHAGAAVPGKSTAA